MKRISSWAQIQDSTLLHAFLPYFFCHFNPQWTSFSWSLSLLLHRHTMVILQWSLQITVTQNTILPNNHPIGSKWTWSIFNPPFSTSCWPALSRWHWEQIPVGPNRRLQSWGCSWMGSIFNWLRMQWWLGLGIVSILQYGLNKLIICKWTFSCPTVERQSLLNSTLLSFWTSNRFR